MTFSNTNSKLQKQTRPSPPKGPRKQPNNNWLFWMALGLISLILLSQTTGNIPSVAQPLKYSEFYKILKDNHQTGRIQRLNLTENVLTGTFADNSKFIVHLPENDEAILDLIRNNVHEFEVTPPNILANLIINLLPVLLIILFIWYISYRGSQMGNKIWSFGKSRARINTKENNKVTFKDVAGVDEAKEELQEVIEFLKEPKKFQRLGGKIPKGVLLIGPPGTGKTLLARAVAGEAEVPFFSLSGSDFVEMFVGVGASRVRDLFEQGRRASKVSGKGAIIFIDEIDAVGRLRFTGIGGGNDEREQTLNALLVEMDGFNTETGVIIIAATNRPDTLDPALLRPGRFDRQIVISLPDINGREGILKVHTKDIKLAKDVDLKKIARQSVYFSGADLANVCNEAALLAARHNKEAVTMAEMEAAIERVTMGPEKKSRVISKKEKEMTAYHEAGHALLSILLDEVDTFTKVSIIPRGMSGGYTLTPPTEDKHYYNKKELKGIMTVLLGGLVGEELFMEDSSTGVSNDLQKVREIAHAMICQYGMNDSIGKLAYGDSNRYHFLGRDLMEQNEYSEDTAKNIDQEVRHLVNEAYHRAKKLLMENREKLDLLAKTLVEKEVLDVEEVRALLNMPDAKKDIPERPATETSISPELNTTATEKTNRNPSKP